MRDLLSLVRYTLFFHRFICLLNSAYRLVVGHELFHCPFLCHVGIGSHTLNDTLSEVQGALCKKKRISGDGRVQDAILVGFQCYQHLVHHVPGLCNHFDSLHVRSPFSCLCDVRKLFLFPTINGTFERKTKMNWKIFFSFPSPSILIRTRRRRFCVE